MDNTSIIYLITFFLVAVVHLHFLCFIHCNKNKVGYDYKTIEKKSILLAILVFIFFAGAVFCNFEIDKHFIFLIIFSLWLYIYDSFIFDDLHILDCFKIVKNYKFDVRCIIFGCILVIYSNFSEFVSGFGWSFLKDNQLIMTICLICAATIVCLLLNRFLKCIDKRPKTEIEECLVAVEKLQENLKKYKSKMNSINQQINEIKTTIINYSVDEWLK